METSRCKLVLLSGKLIRWSPLFISLLLNTAIIIFIVDQYPKPRHHHLAQSGHQESTVRLTGPNMTSIELQILNRSLANRSICVDYRTLNLADLHNKGTVQSANHTFLDHHHTQTQQAGRRKITAQDALGIKKFVFFVGYPRSGHSIVASMLDAHPNVVIAHEYNLFPQWQNAPMKHKERIFLYNALYKNSAESALSGWRSELKSVKGYTLGVDYPWQGGFTQLKIIGDKSGATTSNFFEKNTQVFMEIVENLKKTTGVPIHVIHVVRNPYDMISTRLLYADGGKKFKLPATKERKHCNTYGLGYHTNRTFHIVSHVQRILERTNLSVLEVHHADLIRDPRGTLSMMGRFLNLPFPNDYLEACMRKVYTKPSKTRLLVSWPENMIEKVYHLMKPYRFLWRYSFEGD